MVFIQADGIVVRTFSELALFIKMLKAKDLQVLVIQSQPGLGKTELLKQELGTEEYHLMASHVTPLQNYIELYENKGKLIVYEDVTELMRSGVSLSILKQLTETRLIKEMHYHSTSKALTAPISFQTTSNVLITVNDLSQAKPAVKALLSRGLLIRFEPTRKELLKKMEEIYHKIDVVTLPIEDRLIALEFVKENAAFAKNLSLRILVKVLQFLEFSKTHEFDWKANALKLMDVDAKSREVWQLMLSNKGVKEQLKEFSGSRSEYFRIKKEVLQ